MTRRLAATLVAFLITFAGIHAQHPRVRNFPVSDFNGGLQTWCIAQGVSGQMLFGNSQALMTFDGDAWTKYPVPNYSPVRAVYYDERSRRAYVGASDEMGYFVVDERTFNVKYHSLTGRLPKEHRSFGEIWNIFNHGNDVIFQSKNALFAMVNDNDMIKVYTSNTRIEHVAYVHGRIITAGKESIGVLRIGGGISPLPGTDILKGKLVRAILPYHQQILFVTSDAGLFAYDGKTTMPVLLPATQYLIDNQVFCADINGDDIAFGTVRGGLVVCNMRTGACDYSNLATGMQNNTVLSVKFDRDKNLWAGLDNGICYVLKESSFQTLFGSTNQIGTGYAVKVFNGQLYMGTNQGLFLTAYPIQNTPIPPAPQLITGMTGQVWTLDSIGGTLLCGTDNGAYIVRGTTTEKIQGVEGTWKFARLSNQPDRILACDYLGFLVLERSGGTYTLHHRITGFNEVSGEFLVDDDGSIWVAQWLKGVFHIWLNDEQTAVARQEYFHKDKGLLTDEGNLMCRIGKTIYVSSVDGLYRYDKAAHNLVHDEKQSKIFNEYGVALRIFETPSHDLWAHKTNFLARALYNKGVSGFERTQQAFARAAAELTPSGSSMCFVGDKQIICSGSNGFFYLNGDFKDNTVANPTFIRRVVSTNNGDSTLCMNITFHGQMPRLKVPHKLNSLRIEFVQPEYRDENAVVYYCLLEGYDSDWNSGQTATDKEYTHLSKGKYTFRVKATNLISGKTDEASIDLEILPAWYETWLAYLIYTILIGTAAYYTYLYIKRRAQQERDRLRNEKERQMKEQQAQFELEQSKKENEIVTLRNKQMEYDMKQKSSELADSTMNLVRKNDFLQILDENVQTLGESIRREEPKNKLVRKVNEIRHDIQSHLNDDANWDKFEENFNLVYDNFMQELIKKFPDLKKNDRKLCAYLRMGLSSKEMASLMNTSVRSIETARYRLRKKLELDSGANLTDFIQSFEGKAD